MICKLEICNVENVNMLMICKIEICNLQFEVHMLENLWFAKQELPQKIPQARRMSWSVHHKCRLQPAK